VAQAYNPSYSGDRDQEDHSSWQIISETLSQKNPSQKRAGEVAGGVGPEFKLQYHKKKKKRNKKGKENWTLMKRASGFENICFRISTLTVHIVKLKFLTVPSFSKIL
jgi:hypothetical protein